MKPYTEAQKKSIAKNLIAACSNIEKLNGPAYKFINLANGFIAHYDINGFKAYYSEHSLQADIEANAKANQWHNFSPKDIAYEYYMSKRDIYNQVLGGLVARDYVNKQFDSPIEFMRTHFTVIHVKGA